MEIRKNKLILVTGGHVTPAVACIEELQSRGFNDIVYVGQKKSLLFDKNSSAEYRLIKDHLGIPFYNIIAGKLSLFFHWHSIIWLLRLPIGFFQACYILIKLKPSIILTFGSHVAVPICFWAGIFKIPIIAHEQTTTIGRSNKFIQKFAKRVCVSWEPEIAEYQISSKFKDKFVLTGNPIRKAILKAKSNNFLFKDKKRRTIFITGGNQGAHAINEFVFANIARMTSKFNVIHQTGSNTLFNDFDKARKIAEKINCEGIVYIPRDYIFVDEMAEAYAKSDVVVSRAGANTVTELLVLKKKAILIPIPTTSGNEQFKNAKLLEELGLAYTISQDELDFETFNQILYKLLSSNRLDVKRINKLSTLHKNSHKLIIDLVEENLL